MDATVLLSLRQGVSLVEQAPDSIFLHATFVSLPNTSLKISQPSPTLLNSIEQLMSGSISEQELSTRVLQVDGVSGLYKLNLYLRKMAEQGMLCYTLCMDQVPLATIVPLTISFQYNPEMLDPEKQYVLSRFAYLRKENDEVVLESPLGFAQVRLHHRQAHLMLSELSRPQNSQEFAALMPEPSEEVANQYLNLLLNAQAVLEVQENRSTLEDTDQALAQWEFHDLLFHTRSRLGRHNNPFGMTFRFEGKIEPLSAIKTDVSDDIIPLYKPDLEQLKLTDPPFAQVLEARRSIRSFADQPISDQQLGEFLYRAARVKWLYDDRKGGVTFRQSPSGGALHSLEIYPVIDRCENIPAGLYYYNPHEHHLCRLSERNWYVDTILEMAWYMIHEESRPQILLEIMSRFQRVQWKYSSIAYSVILKDVGCLYQTMGLVAEAMGLAGCALGGGHADLSAQAAGLNYYAETSVGGFVLGTKGEKGGWIMEHVD